MAVIYLVRHGSTELNDQGRLRGWMDVPLNRQGRKEAINVGEWFKNKPISLIYSSDMKRALETSHEIVNNTGAQLVPLASLRPINWGEWNGAKLDDIQAKFDGLTDRWKQTPDAKAPGGDSFSDFQNRNSAVFESVLKNLKPKDQVVISAHLSNLNHITGYVKNGRQPLMGDKTAAMEKSDQEPAAISTFSYNPEKDKVNIEKLDYTDKFGE